MSTESASDITDRLRRMSRLVSIEADLDDLDLAALGVDPAEAADEIERLRAENDALRAALAVALGGLHVLGVDTSGEAPGDS